MSSFFMESLDATILNTAVPVMAAALGVVPLSMKSVLSSYTLSLAVFIPISSWMADRYGTRKVFSSAIGVFTFGSLLCGVSTNIHLTYACSSAYSDFLIRQGMNVFRLSSDSSNSFNGLAESS